MQNMRWKTQVTKEGWAEMLPIYLAMLDGDDEKSKFESLYLTYRKLMFHVANGILNDEGLAEDAVHQALLAEMVHGAIQVERLMKKEKSVKLIRLMKMTVIPLHCLSQKWITIIQTV
jgi:RNA polymerase sigma-70 factor (ECF subfamily)